MLRVRWGSSRTAACAPLAPCHVSPVPTPLLLAAAAAAVADRKAPSLAEPWAEALAEVRREASVGLLLAAVRSWARA